MIPDTKATNNLIKGAVRVGLLLNLRIRKLSTDVNDAIKCLYLIYPGDSRMQK